MTDFKQLGLCSAILSALADLGYQTPTPIQVGAIPPALIGRDVLGIAQTGTGKTCAFACPILQRLNAAPRPQGVRPIRALVLTPTRELALQIQESFEQYGKNLPLKSVVIFGGVGQQPQVDKLKAGVDILVATPGRLLDLQGQGFIDLARVETFVLDEADRMLDMGFIHDVKRVLKLLPDKKQTLFFSATMPPEVTALVNALLHDAARVAVTPVSSPVEVIDQRLYFVDKKNKTKLLAMLVEGPEVKNALVFSRTKHGANKIAQDLTKLGITAAAIHGNKSQTARVQALSDFKAGRIKVLAATDIAARGLDIEELSHVFNYNLPDVPETYVHRIGRTGRAGHGGTAVTFCEFNEKDDLKAVEKLLGKPIPVVEGHPFPMENFDPPQRDKHGKIVNSEDAEARQAARERKRERSRAGELGPERGRAEGRKRPADQPETEGKRPGRAANASVTKPSKKPEPVVPVLKTAPAPQEPRPKKGRPVRHEDLDWFKPKETAPASSAPKTARDEAFERWMAEERAIQAGKAAQSRRGLDDDVIMDATARLLAPKQTTPPAPSRPLRPIEKQKPLSTAQKRPSTPSERRTNVPPQTPTPEGRKGPLKAKQKGSPAKPTAPTVSGSVKLKKAEKLTVPKVSRLEPVKPVKPVTPAKPADADLEARKARARARARDRGPVAPTLRPTNQKDSTEQKSLMKPYYLNDEE